MVQCLMHQQDGVVHHRADQDDKAQQGKHVERLEVIDVEDREPRDTACGGQRDREHDDQREDKALEQDRHHQIDDGDGDDQIEHHRFPGLVQLICGPGNVQPYALRQPFLCHRRNDFFLYPFDGCLERDIVGRADLDLHRALAFEMANLGRALRDLDPRQHIGGQNLSRPRDDRQIADPLGAFHLLVRAHEGEVDPVGPVRDLGDPQPVIEGIDGYAEIACGKPDIGEFQQIGNDPHFGGAEFQPRAGTKLRALATRHNGGKACHCIAGQFQQRFQIGPGDVEVDDLRSAKPAPEDRCLARKAERAGFGKDRPA